MNRKYDMAEQILISAAYETFVKQNISLSLEKYQKLLSLALKNIIFYNIYSNFTSYHDARRLVFEILDPKNNENFFDFVVYKIGNDKFRELVTTFSYDKNGNRTYKADDVSRCIDYYVKYILPKCISDEYITEREKLEEDDDNYNEKIASKIKNPIYCPPSNACREAVMSGKQICFSRSDAIYSGMQAYSHIGKVRKNQEDSYYIGVHPGNHLFKIMLVADGMGGHQAGEFASNLACKEIIQWFEGISSDEYFNNNNENLSASFDYKCLEIDKKIKKLYPNAGTTLCAAIVKNNNIFISNVGDSQGIVMENGNLIYQTESDNLLSVISEIPESFSRFHSRSNVILYGLGVLPSEYTQTHHYTVDMKSGNVYQVVLCSDGISDCLTVDQLVEISNATSKSENLSQKLVDSALNSRSSFQEELEKYRIKSGILGRKNYNNLVNLLSQYGMDYQYDSVIMGGKDNTTSVNGVFKRGR